MHNDISSLGLIFLHSFRDKWNERRARHTMKHERLTIYNHNNNSVLRVLCLLCSWWEKFSLRFHLWLRRWLQVFYRVQCRQAIHLGAHISKCMLSIFHGAATNQTMAKQPNRIRTFHFEMYFSQTFISRSKCFGRFIPPSFESVFLSFCMVGKKNRRTRHRTIIIIVIRCDETFIRRRLQLAFYQYFINACTP